MWWWDSWGLCLDTVSVTMQWWVELSTFKQAASAPYRRKQYSHAWRSFTPHSSVQEDFSNGICWLSTLALWPDSLNHSLLLFFKLCWGRAFFLHNADTVCDCVVVLRNFSAFANSTNALLVGTFSLPYFVSIAVDLAGSVLLQQHLLHLILHRSWQNVKR